MLSSGSFFKFNNIDERPLLNEFIFNARTLGLRPSQIVEYCREPFIYASGNVRVTFDTRIKAASPHDDIFDKLKATAPAMDKGVGILEVKYDAFLPDHIRDVIQVSNKQIQSNSKYVLCKLAMNNYK